MFRILIIISTLLVSCVNSSTRRVIASNTNNKAYVETVDASDTLVHDDSLHYVDSIVVKSIYHTRLDTLSSSWNMTEEEVHAFFAEAIPSTNSEVAKIVSENYHPFSIAGEVMMNGKEYEYTITPAGTAILFPSSFDENSQYIFLLNDIHILAPKKNLSRNLKIKILSYHKNGYEYSGDLGEWSKDWWLSATDIDNYFDLCEPWDENIKGAVNTLFYNYNCDIDGYLEMNDHIYYYRLWCNGPFILTPARDCGYEERLNFVCQDKAGLKYIYEVEDNPTLDM